MSEEATKPDVLLWLDFETTGIDRASSLPLEEYLDSLSQRFTLVPAGTNVDFDLDFLKRLNLNPDAWLSYRKFDLTTLRRYLTFLDCPEDPYKGHNGSHRVRDCIRRDINDYRWYRELLKGAW